IDENTEVVVADVQYLSFFETILEKRSQSLPFMHNYFIPNRASLISHSDEAREIVNFVKEVFMDYLSSAPWLDDETFEIASNKLEN
ncbi:hypothetical protein Avbf_14145, partial [Armadillidium vulgare]